MQFYSSAHSMASGVRLLALGLTLVLGLEWGQPILAFAQPNGTADSAPLGNDELPPIQEAETVEVRSPFYKRWWFWTIVAVVVGGAAVAMAGGGGGGGGSTAPAGPGNVNVKW